MYPTNRGSRLPALDDRSVTFSYKDYAEESRRKTMTLAIEEFTRRFCLHLLPERFVKIRHYGPIGTGRNESPVRGKVWE
ncbi:MAG: transposase [Verrucomicrobiota bacterium]